MGKTFGAIRVLVSRSEKKKRVANYLNSGDENINYSSFDVKKYLDSVIYDEYVFMKCPSCGHVENIDVDTIDYLMRIPAKNGYPRIECHNHSCDDFMIPDNLIDSEPINDDLPF